MVNMHNIGLKLIVIISPFILTPCLEWMTDKSLDFDGFICLA